MGVGAGGGDASPATKKLERDVPSDLHHARDVPSDSHHAHTYFMFTILYRYFQNKGTIKIKCPKSGEFSDFVDRNWFYCRLICPPT